MDIPEYTKPFPTFEPEYTRIASTTRTLETPTGEARCPLTRPCQQKRSPQRHFTRRGQNLAAAGTSPGTAIAHTCTRLSI